jgi:chromosome segregation ATPase
LEARVGGTPLLNQLLEEAAGKCLELRDQASTATHSLDDLHKRAVSARESLSDEGEETHHAIEEIVQKVEAAQGRLETANGNAQTSFEALAARAGEVRTQVDQLLAQVKASVSALEAREDELSARLDTAQDGAEHEFEALSQRVHDLQGQADARLQEASSAITLFRESVETARQDFGAAQTRFLQAADQLEAAAWAETQAYTASVQTFLHDAATTCVEMGNRIVDAHNEAVVALRKKVAEEAVQKVVESIEPVNQALSVLADGARAHDQGVRDALARLGAKAEAIVDVLRTGLAPVLSQGDRLR